MTGIHSQDAKEDDKDESHQRSHHRQNGTWVWPVPAKVWPLSSRGPHPQCWGSECVILHDKVTWQGNRALNQLTLKCRIRLDFPGGPNADLKVAEQGRNRGHREKWQQEKEWADIVGFEDEKTVQRMQLVRRR